MNRITPSIVLDLVAEFFNVTVDQLKGLSVEYPLPDARSVYFNFCDSLCDRRVFSTKYLAKLVGKKANNASQWRCKLVNDPSFKNTYDDFKLYFNDMNNVRKD
jgi:hypothetical protein